MKYDGKTPWEVYHSSKGNAFLFLCEHGVGIEVDPETGRELNRAVWENSFLPGGLQRIKIPIAALDGTQATGLAVDGGRHGEAGHPHHLAAGHKEETTINCSLVFDFLVKDK